LNLETASVKELLYASYHYKHCDGDCDSCPCFNEDYDCSEVHDEIEAELNSRKELRHEGQRIDEQVL
jgi:hypothetical protein